MRDTPLAVQAVCLLTVLLCVSLSPSLSPVHSKPIESVAEMKHREMKQSSQKLMVSTGEGERCEQKRIVTSSEGGGSSLLQVAPSPSRSASASAASNRETELPERAAAAAVLLAGQ